MLDLKKTDLVVRNLKSNGKQYEKFLGGGLSVIVSASTELKTFFYTYKIDRKNARVKLGVYPYTTVKSAVEAMEVERSRVKSAPTPELAELIPIALAYNRDFVAPTLQKRKPEGVEIAALQTLDARLAVQRATPAG